MAVILTMYCGSLKILVSEVLFYIKMWKESKPVNVFTREQNKCYDLLCLNLENVLKVILQNIF